MTPVNPWLDVPLADYEAHMALPHVGQAELIAERLDAAVRARSPASIAVLGCAGGNGFERLPESLRVVGVDVNAAYIAAARSRHAARLPRLELLVADVERDEIALECVELVYAALFFEYVDAARVLDKLRAWLERGGALVTVLQMPSDAIADVTPSPYTSLERLAPAMRLLAPQDLAALAAVRGYRLLGAEIATASGRKRFAVQTFSLDA
jgi:trans-aconitate methyltransferase